MSHSSQNQEDVTESCVRYLKQRFPHPVEVGVICGSGLADLAKTIQQPVVVPYSELKGFPKSMVHGHKNEMVFGRIGSKRVVALRGRFHFYSGHDSATCVLTVRLLAALGVKVLVVTNAAGSLVSSWNVGDIMILKDHISLLGLTGHHPLIGANDERFGPRFPSVSNTYDSGLQKTLRKCHSDIKSKLNLREGVYVQVSGPSYETRAEIQMLRIMQAQAVGMSTTIETIAAAHSGLKVIGMSLITNVCLGPNDDQPEPNHQEVLDAADSVSKGVQDLVSSFIDSVDTKSLPQTKTAAYFTRRAKL